MLPTMAEETRLSNSPSLYGYRLRNERGILRILVGMAIQMPTRLLPAIIYQAGNLAAKVLAVDNHVNEAVLEHEFGRLESLG